MNSILKRSSFKFLIYLICITDVDAQVIRKSPIFLSKGEQTRLWSPRLIRYSIGLNIIRARYHSQKKILLIKALKKGNTDLWIWQKNGSIVVYPVQVRTPSRQKKQSPPHWQKILNDLIGIEVYPLSDKKTLIRGQINTLHTAQLIEPILTTHPKKIVSRVYWNPDRLKEIIQSNHPFFDSYPNVQLLKSPYRIIATVPDEIQKESLEKKLANQLPMIPRSIVVDPNHNQSAFFSIYLLSVKSSFEFDTGFSWFLNSSNTWISELNLETISKRVRFHQKKGDLKILSHPQIAISIPGKAKLFSGIEIPIRQNTQYSSKLSWKNSGLEVDLWTRSIKDSWIDLKIKTSMSQTQYTRDAEQAPQIISNHLETEVKSKLQNTLMIGGLSQIQNQKTVNGIPLLSSIPILGALFGQIENQSSQMELVILITPYRYPPKSVKTTQNHLVWPTGPVPSPRNYISEIMIKKLKEENEYPWNALE